MSENRLQHDLIMWFGQNYPQYRSLLFMVHNETTSKAQGAKLKSMGLIAGVSDLIFIDPNFGTTSGIELKAPGSVHKSVHVKQQLDWGHDIMLTGCRYLITSSLLDAKNFITYIIERSNIGDIYDIQHNSINFVKNQLHKKTIKF